MLPAFYIQFTSSRDPSAYTWQPKLRYQTIFCAKRATYNAIPSVRTRTIYAATGTGELSACHHMAILAQAVANYTAA
jgi:hypothetical protein